MKYNPDVHHRRSVRLKNYDYSREGAYFVTLCTHGRECVFGDVINGEMRLNEAGEMVMKVWRDLPARYSNIEIDEFIVMPNHVHGIIVLPAPNAAPDIMTNVGAGPRACPVYGSGANRGGDANHGGNQSNTERTPQKEGQPQGVAPTRLSLPDIAHRFKSFATAQYRANVRQNNWPPFNGKLWQRNYYEHVIRNDDELNHTREYIVNNPARWAEDEENPGNVKNGR